MSGLGFGIISGAFSLVNVLGDMTGPGTVGIYGDSQYFFLVSCKINFYYFLHKFKSIETFETYLALITLCFILLHTCWSIILYLSLTIYNKKSIYLWCSVASVFLSHLFVSCLSLANDSKKDTSYIYTVVFSYLTLVLNAVYAFYIVKKTYKQKLGMWFWEAEI